jgi:hypothetical protein
VASMAVDSREDITDQRTALQREEVTERRRVPRWRAPLADALGVVAGTVVLLTVSLRLWEANLRVPFIYNATDKPPSVYAPDAPFYVMLIKSLIDHGSYLRNPSLGAPFSQQLYDYPHGNDNLQFAIQRAFGYVLRDASLTTNVYYLFTFVAVSVAAWFVLRRLGVSRPVAAVIAILYSFLPYHFARGEAHLLLSGYYLIPIATLLILRVLSDHPPFIVDRDGGWGVSFRSRSALLWLLACAGLASTGPYYAWFTMVLLFVAVAADFVARRSLRTLAAGGLAIGAIVIVYLANLAPSFLYWQSHGRNQVVARRGVSETEIDGLRVSQLVLPRQQHRVGFLAEIQEKSDRFSPVRSERGQQLGVIGALGFLGLLAFTVIRLGGRRRRETGGRGDDAARAPPEPLGSREWILTRLGLLTVVAVFFATISGFSLLIAAAGLHEFRSWNRISVFLAFFALTAVAFAIDWLLRRLRRRKRRSVLVIGVCAVVLLVGVLDQTSPADVPDYQRLDRAWHSDAVFMHRIEKQLGPGASVFQLPYVIFPEAGQIAGTGPYDQVRGWLHADRLRWSWGAVRGRESDWQAAVVRFEPQDALDALAAVGFSGVMLDRAGFDDRGALVEYAYTGALHQEPQTSPNRRLSFFDLRPRARELRQRLGKKGVERLRKKTLEARPPKPAGTLTSGHG